MQFPSVVGTALVARKMKSGDRGGERQRGKEGEGTDTERGKEVLSKETPLTRTMKTQLETFVPGSPGLAGLPALWLTGFTQANSRLKWFPLCTT